MLPKTHIILGAIFSIIFKLIFPSVDWIFILFMFLATFLIDFDHYFVVAMRTNNWSLINALNWFDEHIKMERKAGRVGLKAKKSPLMLLHTIEFHILVLLMSYLWIGFLYIFIGMAFHSLMDIIKMEYTKELHCRWFFLTEWMVKKLA